MGGDSAPSRQVICGQSVAYNLRFPGQVFDGQAGLHQNYFRDYDPAVGRYMVMELVAISRLLWTDRELMPTLKFRADAS